MKLDLSSLERSIAALGRGITFAASRAASGAISPEEQEVVRAGVIQSFEFTYELCWKFMKRWLADNVSPEAVDGVPRKELFRFAAENRLIANVETWFQHHQARNLTSHTYDQNTAERVYQSAIRFHADAVDFLNRLTERNV